MAATRIQFKTNPGVANGDSIASTFTDSNVVLGNKIVVRVGSYNQAAITAGHCTDNLGNTYVLDKQKKRTSDGFSVAILSTIVTNAGACTVTVNVTNNNYYALYIEEWEGLGDAVDSADGEGSDSTPTTGTNTLSHSADGYAFAMMTHASSTTSIAVGSGWTQDSELESNDTTLTYSAMSRATTASSTYTADWALGASCSWIAVSVIYELAEEDPETWSDTADIVNSQTGEIESSYTPAIGGTFIITCDAWTPTDAGTDPTASMISGNNGGSFTRDHLLSTTEVDVANVNAHGLAHIRHVVESIDNLPYTFDIDLGEAGSYGQWTATYYPNIDNATDPVLYTGKDYLPHTGDDPNIIPQTIPCTTDPIDIEWSNVWISTTAANGGHEGVIDVNAPAGYTSRHKQNENSEKYSGHTADKFLETPGTEDPTYDVDQPVGPGAGTGNYVRGSVVVYRTTSSVQEESGGQPYMKRLGGVPHMPGPKFGAGVRGGVW